MRLVKSCNILLAITTFCSCSFPGAGGFLKLLKEFQKFSGDRGDFHALILISQEMLYFIRILSKNASILSENC